MVYVFPYAGYDETEIVHEALPLLRAYKKIRQGSTLRQPKRMVGPRPARPQERAKVDRYVGVEVPTMPPSYRAAMNAVCERHNLPPEALIAKDRTRHIVFARHEWWWVLRVKLGVDLAEIGRRSCADHTSVMHGVRQHQARLDRGEA